MRIFLLPLPVLFITSALAFSAAFLVVYLAISQPSIGVTFGPSLSGNNVVIKDVAANGPGGMTGEIMAGQQLEAISTDAPDGITRLELQVLDVTPEPDVLPTYQVLNQFRARQNTLHQMLLQPEIMLHTVAPDGTRATVTVQPRANRPIGDLALTFWVQIFVGFTGLVVGAWVWSLRRASLDSTLLLIAGAGLMASAYAAAIYSTRELAIAGDFFKTLSTINQFSALVFGVATFGLFAIYPIRLLPKWAIIIPAVLILATAPANFFQIMGDHTYGAQVPILVNMILICIMIGWQYRATTGDPVSRAILVWLGLSFLIGIGVFGVLISAPPLFGAEILLEQSYAFMGFLFIYVGIALGVARYRLFDLQDWSLRILSYLAAIVLLLGADMALVFGLSIAPTSALALALLVSLTLYLPLRDFVSSRLLGRSKLDLEHVFDQLTDIALSTSSYCRVWCLRLVGHAAIWSGFVVSIPSLNMTPVMTLAR
ncbi:MAG: hypothetical protein Q9M33_13310 [Robiginitomaculum sp.]|nr:hypothetical protein [Robiginitomaculum sp.]